jgi:hypothetical protein
VERIRLTAPGLHGETQASKTEQFDHLLKVNYKFMNYGRRSLLGGEKVIHTIFQPEIRTPIFQFLGRTYYRSIFPTHMSILTEGELIMIREEGRQRGDDRYGGIWDYIPLNKIITLTLSEKGSNLLVLSIHLPENECLEYIYQASMKQEVDQLLQKFKEW